MATENVEEGKETNENKRGEGNKWAEVIEKTKCSRTIIVIYNLLDDILRK
jgi:hypothetical protein